MSLGEKLRSKQNKVVEVVVDGETCLVRGLGRIAKNELLESCHDGKNLDARKLEAGILAACVCDPETNEPALPNPEDWDLPSHISGPLVEACMKVCGFGADEIETATKNSNATAS